MIKLRPHHLMCTQGYSGKGYNLDFVKNMDYITSTLRSNKNILIELVFTSDDICSCCPSLLKDGSCLSENKVRDMDSKVISYFNLKEGVYNYFDITLFIRENITPSIMEDICGLCQWYPISSCRNKLL